MTACRGWPAILGGASVLGFLFGGIVSLLNGASWTFLGPFSIVLGVGWSWAAAGVVMGVLATSAGRAVTASLLFLLMAVVAYYLADLAGGVYEVLDRTDPRYLTDPTSMQTMTDWSGLYSDLLFWSVAAALLAPVLGLIGRRARRTDLPGLLCRLVVPLGAVAESALRLDSEVRVQPDPVKVATLTLVAIAAVVMAGTFVARHWSQAGTDPQVQE